MILQETIDIITELYGESLKRITIGRIVIGVFFTGVKLSNGYGGVSYTPISEIHQDVRRASPIFTKQGPLNLKGMPVHEVLNSLNNTPMLNTVKISLLNALSALFYSNVRYRVIEDCDALDVINLDSIKKVGMVGAFFPFLERLKKVKDLQLSVIERRKESLKGDEVGYFVPAEDAPAVIPLCDMVILTGASIANGTIDELLSYTRPEAKVIVAGPTASFLPDAFFKRNVDVVSGVLVTKPDKALDMISEGMGAYHLFDVCVKKINILHRNNGQRP